MCRRYQCAAGSSSRCRRRQEGSPPNPACGCAPRCNYGPGFAWRDLLRGWGYESEILAEHVYPDLNGTAFALDRRGKRLLSQGGVVLHYAVWSETAEVALQAKGPVALYYHNITPGELLRNFNPAAANLCDRGRSALTVFQGRIESLIAVSRFNAVDLREAGLGEAMVVPLLLELPTEVPRRDPSASRSC